MVSFTSLAEEILVSARQLDEHLASKDLAPSSFDQDTLVGLPNDIEAARDNVINTAQTLKQLALGAGGRVMEIAFTVRFQNSHSRIVVIAKNIQVDRTPLPPCHP